MTETEWLESKDPLVMFPAVNGRWRKLRLFACACCRRVLTEFAPPLAAPAVTAAEMAADGAFPERTLAERVKPRVQALANELTRETPFTGPHYPTNAARGASLACSGQPMSAASGGSWACALAVADLHPGNPLSRTIPPPAPPEFVEERAAQADLLRDIFGNPFRSSGLEPEWFTDTVVTLARTMYESRDFGAMPILADALQDAGCDDAEILNHCRTEGEHVRGCWVVDLLLGKA